MTRPTYDDPNLAWQAALDELRHQMTGATFDTWLNGTTVHHTDGDHWTIHVKSTYAVDWLSERLNQTITRTLNHVTGRSIRLTYTTGRRAKPAQEQKTLTLQAQEEPTDELAPPFPGFEPIKSNFDRVPRQYFEIVIPAGPPAVAAFVGQVIHHTLGWIVNWNTGESREWWEVTNRDAAAVSGFSRRHAKSTIDQARALGYVVRAGRPRNHRYRLRRYNEPVDFPTEDEDKEED